MAPSLAAAHPFNEHLWPDPTPPPEFFRGLTGTDSVNHIERAAGLSLVGATPAHATDNSAEVTRFTATSTEIFEGALPECFLLDLVGTNVATETVTGQSVVTSSGVVHIGGADVFAYRVHFPNGMYSYGTSTSHFSFTAKGPLTVFTQGAGNLARSTPRTARLRSRWCCMGGATSPIAI